MKSYNLPKYFCYGTIEFLHDNITMHQLKNMYIFYEKDIINIVFYSKDFVFTSVLQDEFKYYQKKNIDIQTAMYVQGALVNFYEKTWIKNITYDDMWGSMTFEFQVSNGEEPMLEEPRPLPQEQHQPVQHPHRPHHSQKDWQIQLS